jgi:hypothetical protein
MRQKITYVQRKDEDRLFAPIQILDPKFLKREIYRVVDPDDVFECGIYRMNPNAWYILGKDKESRKIFGMYLNSHYELLKNLFIRARTEDPPSFFYQDSEAKRFLLEKFHNNLDYGIFDIDAGKIKIRRMTNKEALHKLEKMLSDMCNIPKLKLYKDEIDSMVEKVEKLKEKMNALLEEKRDVPLLKVEELKKLEEKLLYSLIVE